MFAEDYMTPEPTTVAPTAPLLEAHELLQASGFRHLPVLDKDARLVGILSDRDLRSAVGFDQARGVDLTVSEVMTHDPTTIPVAATFDDALTIFQGTRYGALPVVRASRLVGIITRSDVLRAFFKVLGLDRTGRRLEIALPNGATDVAHAFRALAKAGNEILGAVVSRMRRDGGEPSLYLRVAGGNTRKIEQHLRDEALIVLEPEHS